MHAFEPIPVLAEWLASIGGHLRQQAERGAAVGRDLDELCGWLPSRLLPEQREGELVARIEKRDVILALARSVGNAPHLLGIGAVMPRDRLAPARRLGESRRSEEHTSELQSQSNLVCRLLL